MKVRIEVTAGDIRRGRARDVCACPIALACARLAPGQRVNVYSGQVFISGEGAMLPPAAVAFVHAFDARSAVEPLAFEVELPERARHFFSEEASR